MWIFVRSVLAGCLGLSVLALTGPVAARPGESWITDQGAVYTPRVGSTLSPPLGMPQQVIYDVGCEDNQVEEGEVHNGVRAWNTNTSPPLYLAGVFLHQGAWIDWLTTACKSATDWGAWKVPDPLTQDHISLEALGGTAIGRPRNEWIENPNGLGGGPGTGGSFGAVLCPRDYFVQGFDIDFAQEKQAVARVGVTCLNPRTNHSQHVADDTPLPRVGLTYTHSQSVSCPTGTLAAGYAGWMTQASVGSMASRMAGNKDVNPWITALMLICRPFTPHGHPPPDLVPGRSLDEARTSTEFNSDAVRGQYIGRFGDAAGQPVWLYEIMPDGMLDEAILEPGTTRWGRPIPVGNGWRQFAEVLPGLGNQLLTREPDGTLKWYQHDGFRDASRLWQGPLTVGTGYEQARFFSGGDNILYAVNADGDLVWYKVGDPHGRQAQNFWAGQHRIAPGFGQYRKLFSLGQGIIYGVTDDGRLMWYRHAGHLSGDPGVEGPVQVGSDWSQFRDIIPVGDGVILAIRPDGTMLRYRHNHYLSPAGADPPRPGAAGLRRHALAGPAWDGPVPLGRGWNGYAQVFALMPAQPTAETLR